MLEAAYNDAAGVTAAFNRNILRVVNREPRRPTSDPEAFRHHACYNEAASPHRDAPGRRDARRRVRIRRLDLTVRHGAGREHLDRELVQVHAGLAARHAGGGRAALWSAGTPTRGERFALALAAPRSRAGAAPATRAA